jgi:hypothetical protein
MYGLQSPVALQLKSKGTMRLSLGYGPSRRHRFVLSVSAIPVMMEVLASF